MKFCSVAQIDIFKLNIVLKMMCNMSTKHLFARYGAKVKAIQASFVQINNNNDNAALFSSLIANKIYDLGS